MYARSISLVFVTLILSSFLLVAKEKEPKAYPLHGVVVATRVERVSQTLRVYTDPYGKTHGGQSVAGLLKVYKVRTSGMDYEIEPPRKAKLEIGSKVEFRIDKNTVYVRRGEKEDKCLLVSQGKRNGESK